jgi:hypothetical protein
MKEGNLLGELVDVFGASQVYICDEEGIRTVESDEHRISRLIREQHQDAIRYFAHSIRISWQKLRETHGDSAEAWKDCENWPERDLQQYDNLSGAKKTTEDGARVEFDSARAIHEARARVNSMGNAWWERMDSLLDRRWCTGYRRHGFLDATVIAQIGEHAVTVRVTHTIQERAHGLVHRYPANITIDGKRGTIKQLEALQATAANAPSV